MNYAPVFRPVLAVLKAVGDGGAASPANPPRAAPSTRRSRRAPGHPGFQYNWSSARRCTASRGTPTGRDDIAGFPRRHLVRTRGRRGGVVLCVRWRSHPPRPDGDRRAHAGSPRSWTEPGALQLDRRTPCPGCRERRVVACALRTGAPSWTPYGRRKPPRGRARDKPGTL